MTTTPPREPRKAGEIGDAISATRSNDEIAVTDVPENVVREMQELFSEAPTGVGTAKETVVIIDEQVESVAIVADHRIVLDDIVVIDDDASRIMIIDNDQPDPTFEERRRKRLRREKLKKIRWFKWAVVAVGLVVVALGVLASPLFSVRDVQVEGAVYTSTEAIAAATEAIVGESFFTLDTNAASMILKDDPWVADVRITKHFPDSVVIEIAERVPVVWYVGEDNNARIVDAQGRVIAVLEGWPTEYLQVMGVGPSLQAGAVADIGYRAAAQTVLALPEELEQLVDSLELSPGGELSMTLTSGTIVRFGSPTDLQNKLVSVVVLLRRQDPTDIAVIDVSTGEVTLALG